MLRRRNYAVSSDVRYARACASRNRAGHVHRSDKRTGWREGEELVSCSRSAGRFGATPYGVTLKTNTSQRTAYVCAWVAIIHCHINTVDPETCIEG